jgi:hypothetical protein
MPRKFTAIKDRTVQLHVMAPLRTVEDLTAHASLRDCTLSDILREAIGLWVEKNPLPEPAGAGKE